jgi:replicative DNA helicase
MGRRARPIDRLGQHQRQVRVPRTPGREASDRDRQERFAAARPRLRETTLDGPTNPEILLISSVIQTGDFQTPAIAGVTGEYFHSHRHEWDWLERFVMKYRKVPDKATFRSKFNEFPLLRTVDVEHGVEAVQQAHMRYLLSSTLREATTMLVDNEPEAALSLLHSSMAGFNNVTGSRDAHADALREYSPFLEEARRRIEASNTLGYAGVTFGYDTLNDRTGGLHPGDLAIWAARLGQGKTWMLCKVASEALQAGKKVVFVSLEQPRSQIVFRIHTLLAKALGYSLRHRELMQGVNMDVGAYESFLVALPDHLPASASLYIADPSRGRASPYTLASLMERHDPDLMLLDYLTLMQTDSDEWQGIAKLSKETKLVASQYGVPILAAAQINREGDGGKRPPSAKNLAQSDAIGQDADVIVTMKKESPSVMQLLLAKNRSGQDGQVFWSSFMPNEGRIAEITHDEAVTLVANDIADED